MRRVQLLLVLAVFLIAADLSAAFHLMSVKEVYGGSAAAPDARYVVLQMYAGGQNFVAGHSLIFYGATGTEITRFTFTGNVGNGADQATLLIASPEAVTRFGVAVDLSMTASALLPAGGKVCFDTFDCMSWGSYSGSTDGVGNAFNPVGGIPAGQAARRRLDVFGSPTNLDFQDDTGDSANDFRLATPNPVNNANQTTTLLTTSTALTSSQNPSILGEPVTFTAQVTPPAAAGAVVFKDGETTLGSAPISGSAMLTVSTLPAGARSITAVYQGDSVHNSNTSPLLTQVVNAPGLTAPSMFSAVATSASQVTLSWLAVSGATAYEVHRTTSINVPYTLAATTSGTSVPDGLPLTAGTTYIYKVRATRAGDSSPFSVVDVATTIVFEDDGLAGLAMKESHILQLRAAVNAVRAAAALAPFSFGTSSLAGTPILADHITSLRNAVGEARTAIHLAAASFTDPTITPSVTTIKADHVLQLRSATQ